MLVLAFLLFLLGLLVLVGTLGLLWPVSLVAWFLALVCVVLGGRTRTIVVRHEAPRPPPPPALIPPPPDPDRWPRRWAAVRSWFASAGRAIRRAFTA